MSMLDWTDVTHTERYCHTSVPFFERIRTRASLFFDRNEHGGFNFTSYCGYLAGHFCAAGVLVRCVVPASRFTPMSQRSTYARKVHWQGAGSGAGGSRGRGRGSCSGRRTEMPRTYRQLSAEERVKIETLAQEGHPGKTIARKLGRNRERDRPYGAARA